MRQLERAHDQLVEMLCAVVQTPLPRATGEQPAVLATEKEKRAATRAEEDAVALRDAERRAVLKVAVIKEAGRALQLRKAEAANDWAKVASLVNEREDLMADSGQLPR